LFAPVAPGAQPSPGQPLVYVIPIHDEIERGLVYVIRRGVSEAVKEHASAIVFDMNTPGGQVGSAEEIINIIAGAPVKTCTFVNPNAISAGAIISFATDEIYMAPGARIGAAAPMMMSPMGMPQELPGKIEEKMTSYVASLIRSAAQRKGHDEKLAEAMVRSDVGYTLGDKVICNTNRLLTLTNLEAEQEVERKGVKGPLLSKGTVADLPALLDRIGLKNATVKELRVSPAETIARYVETFSLLLLIGGILGLYIEFKTPGFGLPGIVGILLLALWFWGYHIAGLAGMGEILLFVIGVALLLVEIFLIPGFGFIGMLGIGMVFASIFMAMVEHSPGRPWWSSSMGSIQQAVVILGLALAVSGACAFFLAKLLPKTPAYRNLVQNAVVSAKDGYRAAPVTTGLVGRRGTADSDLRPAGIGFFGAEQRLDVVTRGDYIRKGAAVVIVEARGSRIVVESIPESGKPA
jgi:membrane-bound serine protease (ClpP class)